MRSLIAALAFMLLARVALGGSPSPRDRSWTSKAAGITVDAPPGWMLSTHTGSPHVLALLLHADGARISVSVAGTEASDARALAEQEQRVLEARRFRVQSSGPAARGGHELIADPPRGSERVRQVYLVRTSGTVRQAIVLTLTAPTAGFAARSAGLDLALARLRLSEPQTDEPTAPAGDGTAPATSPGRP